MKLISLNIGKPAPLKHGNKEVLSGIYKQPVLEKVWLGTVNLEGDGQADLVNHGGEDKAVCVYCTEHYAYWSQELGTALAYGAFGENFSVEGMPETEVCIGDCYQIGDVQLQVSQPRQPCFKLASKHGRADLPSLVERTGFTGYYFRVLKEGFVQPGQSLRLVQRHPLAMTVAEANRLKYRDRDDLGGAARLLQIEALSQSWRQMFERRLAD